MLGTVTPPIEGYYPLTIRYLRYLQDLEGSDDSEAICLASSEAKSWIPEVVIFVKPNCWLTTLNMAPAQAAPNGGRCVGAGNYSKDEVLYLLRSFTC